MWRLSHPIHPYPKGSWALKEADRLLPGRDTWHDPVGEPAGAAR